MKNAIKKVFPLTIPVMLGYIPLGIGFGLLMQNAGFGLAWGAASSLFIYSGTAQFVSVDFLASSAALLEVLLVIVVMNARMMFYGLSFLDRFRDMGRKKWYMIFSLTDETYALLSTVKTPEGVSDHKFMLAISAMNQFYWFLGTVLGIAAGSLIHINTTGIDFMMTALFIVLCMDQWRAYSVHEQVAEAFFCAVLALIVFGPDNFMIPSLAAILAILLVRRKPIETKMTAPAEGGEDGLK